MFAAQHSDESSSGRGELRHLPLLGYLALGFISPDELLAARGTIDTSVELADPRSYAERSETLIRGAPISPPDGQRPDASRQGRAKDLIAELNTINAQIHQIMTQVERAVSRLATSG
jgi:hypothetical protein